MFKEKEKMNEINRENTKILNKLVEISKGKLVSSIKRFIEISDLKSCSLYMDSSNRTKNGSEPTLILLSMEFLWVLLE